LLVFRGAFQVVVGGPAYPIKIILPNQYPQQPPKVYFDMQLPPQTMQALQYVNAQNAELQTNYHKQWNPQYTLTQVMASVQQTIAASPPPLPKQ